ncbi:MAG TPA: hypothetical protein VD963_00395 [Phycisphaerales bacterium]|nr:hypothetical protein [Phycisphaerales bacterium]
MTRPFFASVLLGLLSGVALAQPASDAAPATPVPPNAAGTRVAVLDLGKPGGVAEYGVHLLPEKVAEAGALLKREGVEVVILRVHAAKGDPDEVGKMVGVLRRDFVPSFRTIGWVDEATGPAGPVAYCLPELFFTPDGVLGPSPALYFGVTKEQGAAQLRLGEELSAATGRNPLILRAIQTRAPLSAEIGPGATVTLHTHANGPVVINSGKETGTLGADLAVKLGVAKGVAATKEELVRQLSLPGAGAVVWCGQDAGEMLAQAGSSSEQAEQEAETLYMEYLAAFGAAKRATDSGVRAPKLEVARAKLAELQGVMKANPGLRTAFPFGDAWFADQTKRLGELAAGK